MGTVFLAVRDDDQYHKEVAINTLKFEAADSAASAWNGSSWPAWSIRISRVCWRRRL